MRRKELAALLGLSAALTVTGCNPKDEAITQVKDTATMELGSEYSLSVDDYFEFGADVDRTMLETDSSDVDMLSVGEYKVIVTYKEETFSINVNVTDTVAPVLTLHEDIAPSDFGVTIKASDYADAEDVSDAKVYFVTEDGETETLDIPDDLGIEVIEIDYTLVAVDNNGNRSEEMTFTLPIIHDFESESIEKSEGKDKYTEDDYKCNVCEIEYVESPLDEDDKTLYQFRNNDLSYTINPLDDTTMYATQACNVRSGPATTYDKVDSLQFNQEVEVIGKVENEGKTWYVIKSDDNKDHMVSSSLLSTTKTETANKNSTQSTTKAAPVYESGDCDCTNDQGHVVVYGSDLIDCYPDGSDCMNSAFSDYAIEKMRSGRTGKVTEIEDCMTDEELAAWEASFEGVTMY